MRKILECCPSCGSPLEVTRLNCTRCETVIESRYAPCTFCRLSSESLKFIETFVKNRGNIKDVERELGISYPAARGRLNAVIEELGFAIDEDESEVQRREILGRLDRGEITAAEAAQLLNDLGEGKEGSTGDEG